MACWGPEPWGARRLLNHIRQLPPDSAFQRALRGEHADWDQQTELTATVVDAIGLLTHYFLRVNGNDVTEPERFPRPGWKPPEPTTVKLADLNLTAMFEEG